MPLATHNLLRWRKPRNIERRSRMKQSINKGLKALTTWAVGLALLTGLTVSAHAITLSFGAITANDIGDVAIGEAQLAVEVTEFTTNPAQILFTFTNNGLAASSITDVYFDDGTLLGIAQLIDADDGVGGDLGVDFSQGASPGNLPGGNNAAPPFVTTASFLADSDAPTQPSGVNPNESLGVVFDLEGGGTFNDIVDELNDGRLRIGIRVQGFASGGSESFISPPPGGTGGAAPLPEPGTWFLMGTGLIGLLGYGWSQQRQEKS